MSWVKWVAAFFIIRIKMNAKYITEEIVVPFIPPEWKQYISNVTGYKINFCNDKTQGVYRLVTFTALGEVYLIATNRQGNRTTKNKDNKFNLL